MLFAHSKPFAGLHLQIYPSQSKNARKTEKMLNQFTSTYKPHKPFKPYIKGREQ